MKNQILQIAYSLEKGKITEEEAKSEFLSLFGVVKRFKATVDNEGIKDIKYYFWEENKDEAFK